MPVEFGLRRMDIGERRARQFELAAGFERDRAAGGIEEADDMAGFDDRFPAELRLHAFEERADAAVAVAPVIRRGLKVGLIERQFLMFGADAEFGGRLGPGLNPSDELVARRYGRRIGNVAGHSVFRRSSMGETGLIGS